MLRFFSSSFLLPVNLGIMPLGIEFKGVSVMAPSRSSRLLENTKELAVQIRRFRSSALSLQKVKLSLFLIALVIVSVIGVRRIHDQFPRKWAFIVGLEGNSDSPQSALQRMLKSASDEAGPNSGTRLPLARFVQKDGAVTTVYLVQGEFFDEAIEPRNSWRQLGSDALIVSSVDEDRSDIGPSSGPIAHGCTVSLSTEKLQLGQAGIIPCNGPYKEGGHIQWVGVLSPLIWSTESTEVHPCWERYGITSDDGYQACLGLTVKDSLQDLFSQLQDPRFRGVDAMILPAIGTGVGGLSKASFYHTLLADILVAELTKGHGLPRTIVLQARRSETRSTWPETHSAISAALAKSVITWNFQSDHESKDSEWPSLIGVAIGGCLLLVSSLFGISIPVPNDSIEVFTKASSAMLLMWTATAVGLVAVFKEVIALFPLGMNLYVQIAAGFLMALFCGPLLRANRTVEDMLKKS
jgi:hypothetical protein